MILSSEEEMKERINKIMKYFLKKINQNVECELVYIIDKPKTSSEEYIITKEVLSEFELSKKIFVSYLLGKLEESHEDYQSCNHLQAFNRCLTKKLISSDNNVLENLSTVITKEEVFVKKKKEIFKSGEK